jgi:hypothetical protein
VTFDAKSLLTAPGLTVDALAAKLARLKSLGMGNADVKLPDGRAITDLDLVAQGETPAHFVLKPK